MAEPYADRFDTIAVMDHLDIESTVLVGCSMGGGIAMHVALDWPARVDGLFLVGAAARGWEPKDGWPTSLKWDEEEAASEAGDIQRILRSDTDIWLVGKGRTLEDVDQSLVELFIDMDRTPMSTEKERGELVAPFDPPSTSASTRSRCQP